MRNAPDIRKAILTSISLLTASTAYSADLEITSFGHSGYMAWTYPTNDAAAYRIEWATSDDPYKWTDMRAGAQGIVPTGTTMTAEHPEWFRVRALGEIPENMVYIPAGSFHMGDTFNEGGALELPVHEVFVSGFFMDTYEVTGDLWDEVYDWALTNGYVFSNSGTDKATNHAVHTVNWYDAVKWCNARSEREGLTPCYYIDPIFFTPFRFGETDIPNSRVLWSADGYRLPTEAEWEKAARGGVYAKRFPWGDNVINHERATYYALTGEAYDLDDGNTYHPSYTGGSFPYTHPLGDFAPNGYGLCAMAGSVWEWCWDWSDSSYYSSSPADNPRGPTSSPFNSRTLRGGAWDTDGEACRAANRAGANPDVENSSTGFRTVRAPQNP